MYQQPSISAVCFMGVVGWVSQSRQRTVNNGLLSTSPASVQHPLTRVMLGGCTLVARHGADIRTWCWHGAGTSFIFDLCWGLPSAKVPLPIRVHIRTAASGPCVGRHIARPAYGCHGNRTTNRNHYSTRPARCYHGCTGCFVGTSSKQRAESEASTAAATAPANNNNLCASTGDSANASNRATAGDAANRTGHCCDDLHG